MTAVVLRATVALLFLNLGVPSAPSRPHRGLPLARPESVGLLASRLNLIDTAVKAAIAAGEIPGAVVLVGRRGRIAYFRAFGQRALRPQAETMTRDTIFDVASLTKVMATTPAIMLLVQDGVIRLDDRVRRYLPEFVGNGKDAVTVRQLLTHFSGLRPDFDLSVPWAGYPAALVELWKEVARGETGKDFVYSDLNFIALGEIVRRAAGKPLDRFVSEELYARLGMTETGFNPPEKLFTRIAPTESRARSLQYLKGQPGAEPVAQMIRGSVHDPTAWRMEGVAGHAGLFSTARDVAIYAQMLLYGGTYRARRIFAPLTVHAMTRPQSPKDAPVRGLGWDIDSSYSAPRGDLFTGGFGHTGFTGTSLWVHPPTQSFVIILSNRVHPEGKGDATHLRGVVANIVASAIENPLR